MLSLSPRYDLFRFSFPKDFIPKDIEKKYNELLTRNAGVITTPIDYLNESIKGISIPGISDILILQQQHSYNDGIKGLGKINIVSKREQIYQSTSNPLDKINPDIKVTFRMNQGLYNYFMLYEIVFHQICQPINNGHIPVLYVDLLNEDGISTARIKFFNVLIDGIDGIDFSYDKVERDSGTFDLSLKFSNIDFEFLYEDSL